MNLFETTSIDRAIGAYLITGLLARGSGGDIFLVRDSRGGPEMVLKMGAGADHLARGLAHPGIVPVIDIGQHHGRSFVVLEHVAGTTLQATLAGAAPPPRSSTQNWMLQLLDALEHVHAHGLVHRDVKPANLLIGADECLRLADFGIAAPVGQRAGRGGSPAYMAPEQMRGAPADVRADLYAAGAVLYQLLTGARPFEGGAFDIVAQAQGRRRPPSPSARLPGLGDHFDALLARALARDPARRYQCAPSMHAAVLAAYGTPNLTT